ncbi:MAG: mandelate racemase/muconate lactonizing enzyme family protein [Halobacteriaceae archaeon]
MEFARLRARAFSSPIDPPQSRRFHGGERRLLKRDAVVVTLETRDGTVGIAPSGASSSAMREFFEGATQEAFAELVSDEVAPAIEGLAVDGVEELHAAVEGLDLPRKVTAEVISGLDIAYHDIRGKHAGEPVYELLRTDLADDHADAFGSIPPATTELPLYASAGMYMEPEEYAAQASTLAEWGFAGYKYRPGIGPERDVETIERVSEATGDADVMIDAHTWWKLPEPYAEAERDAIVEAAAEHGAAWLEEPVEPDDYDGYRELAGRGVPLAGGESEPDPEGLRALAGTGAVDYLQGDVRHHRGFTGCTSVAADVAGSEVTFVPHHFGTLLGLVANAHLVAALPKALLLEYPVFEGDPNIDAEPDPGMYPFDFAFDLLEELPTVEAGTLEVPDGPGLGVALDEDVLDGYPFLSGPWTEFEFD